MTKKLYKVPCSWCVTAEYICVAESWEDAIEQAEEGALPTNTQYIDGSFEVTHEFIEGFGEDFVSELGETDG